MITTDDAVIAQIKELCKQKEQNTVTYYELMCHMQLPGTAFNDAICELSRTERIHVDKLGNIKLVEKQPEKTYSVLIRHDDQAFPICITSGIPETHAKTLAKQLDEVITNSPWLSKGQRNKISFYTQPAN